MEILDILDEEQNVIGQEERSVIHKKGLFHLHVVALLMNKNGEILFQKRSKNKKIQPSHWTRTGGHVDSGENPVSSIKREVKEELGIDIDVKNFELISIDKHERENEDGTIIDKNFTYSYFAYIDKEIEDFKLQEEEVEEVKYISIEEMEAIIERKDEMYTFTKWSNLEKIMKVLKEKENSLLVTNMVKIEKNEK